MKTIRYHFRLDNDPKKNGKAIYNLILLLKINTLPTTRIFPLLSSKDGNSIEGIGLTGEEEALLPVAERLKKHLAEKKAQFSEQFFDEAEIGMPEVSQEDYQDSESFLASYVEKEKRRLEKEESEKNRLLKSGIAFYHLGMLEDAERQLKRALEKDSGNAEAHHHLGLVFEQNGRVDESIAEFQAAIRTNPESGPTHFFLANAFHKKGVYAEAVEEYKKAIELEPEVPLVYNNLGWLFYQTDEHEKALKAFEEALNLDPEMPFPHNGMGCVFQEMGLLEESVEAFQQALELFPEYTAAHLKLGWSYYHLGAMEEAIGQFKQAIETAEDEEQYTLSAHFSLGQAFMAKNDCENAYPEFIAASGMDPEFGDAHYQAGLCAVKIEKFEEAVRHLEKAIELNPKIGVQAFQNLGAALLALGRHGDALKQARLALKLEPNAPENYELRGNIHIHMRQWDEALRDFQKALDLNPNSSHLHFCLGWAYENKEDSPKAIEEYKKSIQLNPESVEAYSNLGWLYVDQSKNDEALVVFEKAAELKPGDIGLLNNLGWAYTNLHKYEEALSEYRKALKLDPASAMIHNNIGIVYFHLNRLDEAGRELNRAIQLEPESQAAVYAHYYIGQIYQQEKKYEFALKEYQEALKMESDYGDPYFRLGECWKEKGQKAKARRAFLEYLKREPKGEFAARAEKTILELKK